MGSCFSYSRILLAMTGRAVGQLGRYPNLVLFLQFGADFRLIVRGLPVHVKNLVLRPQRLLGVPVAVHAPLHQQSVGLKNQRHLVDLPMARRAADPFIDMNAVIEIDEIGQAVHFVPLDRFVGAKALANRFKIGRAIEKHRVAVHAGLRRRNPGNRGRFHAGMTVTAVNAVIADVMLVAELHRLLPVDVLLRHVRRARHREDRDKRQPDQEKSGEDTESGNEVSASMKNLRHLIFALWWGALKKGATVSASHVLTGKCRPRIVCDAIVSTKTFRNATFPPKRKLLQSWFQQIDLFLQIIQIISRCPSLRRVPPVLLWLDLLSYV